MITAAARRTILTALIASILIVLAACSSQPDSAGSDQTTSAAESPAAVDGTESSPGPVIRESAGPDGMNSVVETPTADARTPILRYAWCLREAGLPAVVIGDSVAFQGDGGDSGAEEDALPGQAEIEADCREQNSDYTPTDYDQR